MGKETDKGLFHSMLRGVSGTPEVFALFRSQPDERQYLAILRGHLSAAEGRYVVGPRARLSVPEGCYLEDMNFE